MDVAQQEDSTMLLPTEFGTIVDPAEYTDEDLRRTVDCLDAWLLQILDGDLSDAASDFASSIGLSGADLHHVVIELTRHGKAGSFFAVRGPTEAFVRKALKRFLKAGAQARDRRTLLGASVGTVAQISVSAGGVPKLAVDTAEVGWRGLVGDHQRTRVHHGRPWQAVCLWSTEVIDALRHDGHPIFSGATGENLTISGLDWRDVRPGARLDIGTCLLEVSTYTVPCKKNAQWFTDRDFRQIHHDNAPGMSRVYAHVLQPGALSTGGVVRLDGGHANEPTGGLAT